MTEMRRPLGRPPRRTVAVVAAGVVVLTAVAVLIGTRPRVPQQVGPATPDVAPDQVLARTNPLAVGRWVDCAGQLVPASTLARPGGVEATDTPESAALRDLVVADPWAGMGSVSGGNWIRLGSSADPLVFGQRQGEIGVGAVVSLARRGGGWEPRTLGGCGLVVPAADERSADISDVTLRGGLLRLGWANGRSLDGVDARLLVRVETAHDDAGLHLLIVTRDNPAASHGGVQVGVGVTSEATVAVPAGTDLAALRGGTVLDDAVVPARAVPVT